MKHLEFVGSSLDDLRAFPAEARRAAGFELGFVQRGLDSSVGEKTWSWLVNGTTRLETGHEEETY